MSKVSYIAENSIYNLERSGKEYGVRSKELSSGKRDLSDDISSSIISTQLKSRSQDITKTIEGLCYSKNLFDTALTGTENLLKILQEQKGIVGSARGAGGDVVARLQEAITKRTEQVKRESEGAVFDNKKLLNGELGGDSKIKSKFKSSTSAKTITGLNGDFRNTAPASSSATVTCATVAANDTITINGKTFTFVANGAVTNESQINIGSGGNQGEIDAATARNVVEKLQSSNEECLKTCTFGVNGTVVSIRNITQSTVPVNVQTSAATLAIVLVNGNAGAVDVTGITNMPEFFNRDVMDKVSFQTTGTCIQNVSAFCAPFARDSSNLAAVDNAASNAISFACKIGDKTFTGVLQTNNGVNSSNYKMKMSSGDQSFTVNFSGTFAVLDGNVKNQGALGAAAVATATSLNSLFKSVRFAETKYVNLDTSAGDIKVRDTLVGSVKNLSATLSTTDFKDLKLQNFTIQNVADIGAGIVGSKFTALIKNKEYTLTRANSELVQGRILNLASNDGDVLRINIGHGGIVTGVTTAEGREAIAKAWQNAFGLGKSLDIRMGTELDNRSTFGIDALIPQKLYIDATGDYLESILVDSVPNCTQAEVAIENAIRKVASEKAKIESTIAILNDTIDSLSSNRITVNQAIRVYTEVNYPKAAEESKAALQASLAAIATLQGYQAQMNRAYLELIKS